MKNISNTLNRHYILVAFLSSICWINLNGQQVEINGDFKAPFIWANGAIGTNTIINDGFEDMTLSPFTTSGDSDWTVIDFDAYTGTNSAVSGNTLPNEISSIFLTVVVPEYHTAKLSFATKSSAIPGDNLFYINNSFEFSVTSTDVWTTFEKELPSGTYNLEWRLEVYGIIPLGQQLRLDAVQLTYIGGHVVRIQDGNEALGKILTSDQYGNATWEKHPTLIYPDSNDNGLKILYPDSLSSPDCIYDPTMSSGDGLFVMNALSNGFESRCSGTNGFQSILASQIGFYATGSGNYGFYSYDSGSNGYQSDIASLHGFSSSYSGGAGFSSNSSTGEGFKSWNDSSYGVLTKDAGLDGIYSMSCDGDEGYFSGTVVVTGNLSKGGGSFKIDHPLDPENKFLYHSFVESPDMLNVYNGNIITDAQGLAMVEMADWFDTLNRDFRYQLTVIGVFAQAIIKEKMSANHFIIQTDLPNVEVSWQITGIRQDPYANNNRIEVEVEKPAEFKGQYIHPEAYNQPFEKGFDYIKLGRKTLKELESEYMEKVEK